MSNKLVEVVHTDIYESFAASSFTKDEYFISFIDEFSHYQYIYLLHDKSQLVDALEVFVKEVKRQQDRKVKIIRSDRRDVYYGKYDETCQNRGPSTTFIQERGICAQYTMSNTLQQNGIVEHKNNTLMDIVRSMRSGTCSPISLRMYAL